MAIRKYGQGLSFIILVAGLIFFWYLSRFFNIDISGFENSLLGLPLILSAFLYVLLYVSVTFFVFFSKDLFWFMGALLFGPFLSGILISFSEIINAAVLFHISRFLGRGYVENKLSGRYSRLDEGLKKLNLFWLIAFRAAPLVPYRFLDLAAGLTGIRFRKYILAVALGTPIKIFWIQYIISVTGKSILNDPSVLAEYLLNNKPLFFFSFIYIILLILVILKVTKRK